jgi:nucleoside-diphosphate-sugar epimerase
MGTHFIVGAGAVGTATADALLALGHEVTIGTRSGRGPMRPGIMRVQVDASDAEALAAVTAGVDVIYNCANPRYDRWADDWPPIATAMLDVARRAGSTLVTMSNLYGYGPVDHPMTTDDPLAAIFTNGMVRAAMWETAKAAYDAGDATIAEVRASDFFGPGTGATSHIGRALPRVLAGKTALLLGDPHQPHTWTYVPDVGRTLACVGTTPAACGQAWHVPSNAPMTQAHVLERAAELAGVARPRIRAIPKVAVASLGLVNGEVRALKDVAYQFDRPFIMDATATTDALGLVPTPLDAALEATIAAERAGAVAA